MRTYTLLALALLTTLSLGYFALRPNEPESPSQRIQGEDQAAARRYLNSNKTGEALGIILPHLKATEDRTAWQSLYAEALVQLKDFRELKKLFLTTETPFFTNEAAALLAAQAALFDGDVDTFDQVRGLWKGKESAFKEWFLLDADKWILRGQTSLAAKHLKSHTFRGKEDAPRLIRLALIKGQDNPKEAWGYLEEAREKDPENPDLFAMRGELLEVVGKNNLAHKEYFKALQAYPNNPQVRDLVANFYLKGQKYPLALDTWQRGLETGMAEPSLLKFWFYDRVTTPTHTNWQEREDLTPVVKALAALPRDKFWLPIFSDPQKTKELYKQEEPLFWLKLLSNLEANDEEGALDTLTYSPFRMDSSHPELVLTLERVLLWRAHKTFTNPKAPFAVHDKKGNVVDDLSRRAHVPRAFKQIDVFAKQSGTVELPKELQALLESDEVFSAIFLATGWFEAGLNLHTLETIPETFPNFVAFNIAEAFKTNRSRELALEFIRKQPPSEPLSLLEGQILLEEKQEMEAVKALSSLSKADTEFGRKAALLTAEAYLEMGEKALAREAIENNEGLKRELEGKETLARIALLEGNSEEAAELYRAIREESWEAKSFLAKKAFDDKSWKEAEVLTLELLEAYPDHPTLNKNLRVIRRHVQ